jgi:splicing factor 3B subunit 3
MFLRIEAQPISGRDHVTFRSSYAPVKDVVDGDLCEMFTQLDFVKQKMLAEELDRNP